jgi:hypothetical protein
MSFCNLVPLLTILANGALAVAPTASPTVDDAVSSLVDNLMQQVVASINATVANRTNTTPPTFAPTPQMTLFTIYTDMNYSHAPSYSPTAAPTRGIYSEAEHDSKVIFASLSIGVALVAIGCVIAFSCARSQYCGSHERPPSLVKSPTPLSATTTGTMSVSVEM